MYLWGRNHCTEDSSGSGLSSKELYSWGSMFNYDESWWLIPTRVIQDNVKGACQSTANRQ